MRLAQSGTRGVFWRANPRGTQELRRQGTERERGDWWARWKCPHGHLHRELIGAKSEAVKESQRRRLERPCPTRTEKPTAYLLRDVIRDYLADTGRVKRSAKEDARHGAFWAERLGGLLLDDVSPAELAKIRAERLAPRAEGDRTITLKPATVNRQFAFLKHVYYVAIRDGKTERNPVAKLPMLREPSGRTRYLDDDEETAVLKALASDDDRDRLTMLLQTGLRKSEFLGLRWRDVDFKAGVLTIPRSKNGETRHVPLTTTVRAILARKARPLDGACLVFPNSEGHADLRWAEKTLPKAVADAQVADFRLHDTRHCFASRLAMAGVDLLTIKALGGWKTLSMVTRYAHLSPSHQREAIERLTAPRPATGKAQAGGAE